MIYVHKILPFVMLPIGLTVIFVAAGLILRKQALCWLGIGLLWVSGLPLFGDTAMRAAEGWGSRLPLQEVRPAKAIVVLSNAPVTPPGDGPILEWDDNIDRFEAGVALYQDGKAPILILTGGWLPWLPEARPFGEVLAECAIARGVPRNQVFVTERVMNTAAEAQAARRVMERIYPLDGGGPVILVTSAFHMRRARILFEQTGMEVIPFPVDFQTPGRSVFTILDLLPTAESLEKTETALREFLGYLYYALRGLLA